MCFSISQFSSVQSLSRVQLFVTPWIAARQASLSITNSRSSLRLMSIESVMPSSHLILCRPLLLLPPIPPSIRVFSSESISQGVSLIEPHRNCYNLSSHLHPHTVMQEKLIFLPSGFHMSVLLTSLTFILKRETAMCQANPLTIFSLRLEWPLLFYPQRMFFLLNVKIMLFLENLLHSDPVVFTQRSESGPQVWSILPVSVLTFSESGSFEIYHFILLFPWSDFFFKF